MTSRASLSQTGATPLESGLEARKPRRSSGGPGMRSVCESTIAGSELEALGSGLWAGGSGFWAVGCELWAVGCGLWAAETVYE